MPASRRVGRADPKALGAARLVLGGSPVVSLASTDPMGWPAASDESDEALGLAQTSPSTTSCERRTLDRILRLEGPLGETRATRVALQIAEALAATHAAGAIHGALAPANVIVTTTRGGERVKLVDAGSERAVFDATRRRAGGVEGGLRYMSPEQWHGGEVGPWTDVYAFGVILYELLTGQPPIDGRSMVELARNVLHAPIAPMRTLRPGLSPVLDAIVFSCLDKDPFARWRSAHALVVALGPSTAPAPQPSGRVGRGRWRAAAPGSRGVAIAAAPGGV